MCGSLKIVGLSKTYSNDVQALSDINLEIKAGMFGLLGPNGAGKSTLMRTIATLQEPDTGTIFLGDVDVIKQKVEIRRRLGYLPQEFGFYPKVSAWDMLDHFASLKGISRSKERKAVIGGLLQKVHLYEHRKKRLGGYSGGMRQRFGIAQALIGDPDLIIVDEPTAGLDPKERNHFHNLLSEIGENKIVILSTHIVEDVSELCQEMAIIHKGRVLMQGNPLEAVAAIRGKMWKKLIEKAETRDYQGRYKISSTRLQAGRQQINVYSEQNPGEGFISKDANLEDVYFTAIPSDEIAEGV
ncbi:MAG: ABC transporter ATP-binding protein [Candidatus Cloacimonetes bacterium]|nr:ABC transporter ATP-binding protein [Candidatus Cloacimonadota bacterium]